MTTTTTMTTYSTAAFLTDLIREVQVEINLRVITCALVMGEADNEADDTARLLTLTEDEIATLAEGGTMVQRSRTWSVARLCSGAGELSPEQWAALHTACRTRRHEQSSTCSAEHPATRLRHYELLIGEPLAMVARLALLSVRPGSLYLHACGQRAGLDFSTSYLSAEQIFNLLAKDPLDWLDLMHACQPNHALFTSGMLDWDRSGDPDTQPMMRVLVPSTLFLAECLGRMIPSITAPGITTIEPTTTLADVVLSDELRALVEPIDLSGVRRMRHALGILLYGPSGTGKTMLAHALAQRAGMPLVQIEAPPAEAGGGPAPWGRHIGDALRRCAVNGAILFLDEADLLLGRDPEVSRQLLTGMERSPAVVILATNRPEVLDPAMDRRLPIKLHLDIPPAAERAEILRRELHRQRPATDHSLAGHPDLVRLAGTFRLAGGTLRNVVRLAGMAADLAHREMAAEDLRHAVHQVIKSQDARERTSLIRWLAAEADAAAIACPPALADEVAGLVTVLLDRQIGSGIILAMGPESGLVDAAARVLSDRIGLPLAQVRDRVAKEDAWVFDELALLPKELGDGAVVVLRADGAQLDRWQALPAVLDRVQGHHLVIVHTRTHAVPAWLQAAAMITVPWAQPTSAVLAHTWSALGGHGPAPRVASLAQLRAAHQRQVLSAAGLATAELVEVP